MSLEENLGDLERHARDFDERMGFTYTVLDAGDDVVGCTTSIRRETASTTPTFSRGCAHRMPARSAAQGGRCRLARTGLAVRAAALRALARLTLAAGDEDSRGEHRDRGESADQVEREASCAHRVHEREESRRDEERGRAEQRDDRGRRRLSPRSPSQRVRSSSDQ